MNRDPTSFEVLYFIKYPPPYPQPERNFFDPRSGAFFPYSWPDHKIGVDLVISGDPARYPEEVLGVPVILPVPRTSQIAPFTPAWKIFRFTWERFLADPVTILKELHTEIIRTTPAPTIRISERELEVLRAICAGIPYRAIGSHLGYSTKTIATVVSLLKEKFSVTSAPALIGSAFSAGILDSFDLYVDGLPEEDPPRRQKGVRIKG